MPLLQDMGVNAIRQYVGIPPRWVQYIYEQYGIFTVLNHTVARYGFTLDGVWTPDDRLQRPAPARDAEGRARRPGRRSTGTRRAS